MDTTWKNQESELDDLQEEESQSRGLKIGGILRLAQRYSLLIAGITVATTSAAYFMASNRPTTYESFFQILVEPVSTEGELSQPTAVARGARTRTTLDYETQIEILKSPRLLSPIVQKIQQEYPDFGFGALQRNLVVERPGRELRIIQVFYKGSDPRLVSLVLNSLAEKYLQYSLEERKSRIGEGVTFIQEQLPDLRSRAANLQQELESLQQENSFFDPQTEGQEIANQIRTLDQQIVDAQRQLREQEVLYDNSRQQIGLNPQEALAASALSEDPIYQSLIQRLETVEQQIAVEMARFKEGSPAIQALQQQRNNLRPLLAERARITLGNNLQNQLSNEQIQSFQSETRRSLIEQLITSINTIEQLEARIAVLEDRRSSLEQEIQKFPPLARRYAEIVRELEIVNSTLNQLLSQRETLKVEAAQNNVPWELVYEPQPPQAQTESPNQLLALGFMGGVAIGMGLAYLIDQRKGTFPTVDDVEDTLSLPVLEVIPSAEDNSETVDTEDDNQKLLAESDDGFSEAFNALYAKILFFYAEPPLKSIVISSASSGDGKTTVAFHLARAIAASGKKVLLVDANLRSPQLHERLGLQNEQGLKQLLSTPQEAKKQRLIQRLPKAENLFILASGGASSDAAQLLASEQMKRLMEKFEQSFDLVIYDTLQLQGYTDAKFIAPNTDGVLFVVKMNQTKRRLVQSAIEELESFKLQILGVIANEGGEGVPQEQQLTSSKVSVNH